MKSMFVQETRGKIVQVGMSVKCNGIVVDYYESPDDFMYTFHIDQDVPLLEADAAVVDIVNAMIRQSYDHGMAWQKVGETMHIAPSEERYFHTFKVRFRIKDTW